MRGTRFCGIMYKSALNNILFTCYWTFQVSLKSIKQAMANQSMDVVAKVLEQVEEQVDAQLSKLNEIEEEDLDRLRERRLDALKKAQKQKQVCVHLVLGIFLLFPHSFYLFFLIYFKEWLSKGHGEYREIPSEKDFFSEVKESKNVVCHFYRDSTFR